MSEPRDKPVTVEELNELFYRESKPAVKARYERSRLVIRLLKLAAGKVGKKSHE